MNDTGLWRWLYADLDDIIDMDYSEGDDETD